MCGNKAYKINKINFPNEGAINMSVSVLHYCCILFFAQQKNDQITEYNKDTTSCRIGVSRVFLLEMV